MLKLVSLTVLGIALFVGCSSSSDGSKTTETTGAQCTPPPDGGPTIGDPNPNVNDPQCGPGGTCVYGLSGPGNCGIFGDGGCPEMEPGWYCWYQAGHSSGGTGGSGQ